MLYGMRFAAIYVFRVTMEFWGEVLYGNDILVAADKGMFQGVLKFPDIARPGVMQKGFPGVR